MRPSQASIWKQNTNKNLTLLLSKYLNVLHVSFFFEKIYKINKNVFKKYLWNPSMVPHALRGWSKILSCEQVWVTYQTRKPKKIDFCFFETKPLYVFLAARELFYTPGWPQTPISASRVLGMKACLPPKKKNIFRELKRPVSMNKQLYKWKSMFGN